MQKQPICAPLAHKVLEEYCCYIQANFKKAQQKNENEIYGYLAIDLVVPLKMVLSAWISNLCAKDAPMGYLCITTIYTIGEHLLKRIIYCDNELFPEEM